MKRCSLFLLFFAAAAAFAADRPLVNVTVDLPQAKLLPGVPFDIIVTYKNVSDHFVAVGKTATLIITPQNGTPVRLPSRTVVERFSQDPNVELSPGATQVGAIGWNANWFYEDASLTVPGIYDIALELTGDPARAEDEVFVYAGTIRTAPTRLVRVEPTGEDADVWSELRAAANGVWPSHGFGSRAAKQNMARNVTTQHPHSAYCPYALLLGNELFALPFDLARDAAEKFADSPAYPHLLLAAGVTAQGEAQKRATAHAPVAEVLRYLQFANDFYDATLRAGDPAVYDHAGGNQRTVQNEIEHLNQAERKHP